MTVGGGDRRRCDEREEVGRKGKKSENMDMRGYIDPISEIELIKG
jgi:hypothetical protein